MGHKTPYLLLAAAFYALGLVGGTYLVPPTNYPLFLLSLLLPLLIYIRKKNRYYSLFLFFFLLFLLGLSLTGLRFQSYLSVHSLFNQEGEELHLLGQIDSIPQPTPRGYTFTFKPLYILQEGEVEPITFGRIQVYSHQSYNYGDHLELRGRMYRPSTLKNPGGFSYRNYLYRQGIAGTFFHGDRGRIERVERGRRGFFYLAQLCKEWIGERLEEGFSYPYSAMLRALLLGERGLLPSEMEGLFRETGLGHLLAVSGLHVGILSLFLNRLLLFLKLKEREVALLLILFMVLYMVICGLRPSIIRAGLVVIFYSLSRILRVEIQLLDLTGLSALLLLLINPFYLFDLGFQLSYLVYLSILSLTPLLKPFISFLPEKIGLSLNLSLAAQLGAWPVIAYYFHQFSLWPILANLVAIPLLSLILMLILPALFISIISSSLYYLLGLLLTFLLQILLLVLESLSSLPILVIKSGAIQVQFLFLYFLLLSLLILYGSRRTKGQLLSRGERRLAILLCILLLSQFFLFFREDESNLKAYFLDVGSGLAIFFILPDGETLFYDGGGLYSFHDPEYNQVAEEIIHPLLSFKGLTRVDGLIISHYHLDHVLGFLPLIQENKTSFIASPERGEDLLTNDLFLEVKELAYQSQIPLFFLKEGDHLRFGEVLFRVLAPPPGLLRYTGSDENNNSLTIRVEYGDIFILLTGDMEKEMEAYLLGRERIVHYLDSHLLQVGHHGSNTSSTTPFLEAVGPQASIISSSPQRFDHPSPHVLHRLSEVGTAIFRTDTSGAIVVETDGSSLSVYPYWTDRSNFRFIGGGVCGI